ncbi:MAG: hypothetical protein ACRC6X_04870 [Culicoidibacterales bacterium]
MAVIGSDLEDGSLIFDHDKEIDTKGGVDQIIEAEKKSERQRY